MGRKIAGKLVGKLDVYQCASCGWHHEGEDIRQASDGQQFFICPMTRKIVTIEGEVSENA